MREVWQNEGTPVGSMPIQEGEPQTCTPSCSPNISHEISLRRVRTPTELILFPPKKCLCFLSLASPPQARDLGGFLKPSSLVHSSNPYPHPFPAVEPVKYLWNLNAFHHHYCRASQWWPHIQITTQQHRLQSPYYNLMDPLLLVALRKDHKQKCL